MKFIITLPAALEAHCFPMGRSKNGNWWIWGDKSTSFVRVYSPSPNPWSKEWTLQPSEAMQRSKGSDYPGRLDLKLFSPEQALTEGIVRYGFIRERYKSRFPGSNIPTSYIKSFPAEDGATEFIWINYAMRLKK